MLLFLECVLGSGRSSPAPGAGGGLRPVPPPSPAKWRPRKRLAFPLKPRGHSRLTCPPHLISPHPHPTATRPPPSQAARAELLGRAGLGDDLGTSANQRERLLTANERLARTGDKIEEGKRMLLSTEDLGVSILKDLHKQRETIVNARETVHETDDFISKSRKVLGSMSRRLVRAGRGGREQTF